MPAISTSSTLLLLESLNKEVLLILNITPALTRQFFPRQYFFSYSFLVLSFLPIRIPFDLNRASLTLRSSFIIFLTSRRVISKYQQLSILQFQSQRQYFKLGVVSTINIFESFEFLRYKGTYFLLARQPYSYIPQPFSLLLLVSKSASFTLIARTFSLTESNAWNARVSTTVSYYFSNIVVYDK